MADDPTRLLGLAEAIADGRGIDWGTAESSARTSDEQALIEQLRLLAGVAEVHRQDDAAVPLPADGGWHWGPLEIRERLGSGSYGTVFRARDARLEREVALKLFDASTPAAAPSSSVTVSEGRMLARVSHPHVITVYGADEFDGRVGIWMELVSGSTLLDVFHRHGRFGAREAALIGIDLCGAVAAVHREGLVHRDIKPQNVMREQGGRIVLMDFGAGQERTTQARQGRMVGTPLYMAPELFEGEAATPQSDIYSLGVLLFWMVTGQFPVPGRTAAEVQETIRRGHRRRLRDERPDLPAAFVSIVERAIAPAAEARFHTVGELEQALGGFVGGAASSRARMRSAVLVIGILALVAASGGVLVWRPWRPPAAAATAPAAIRSVAVVPFTNASGAAGDDTFAAGLADVLVGRLGAIKALRVVAHTSSASMAQAAASAESVVLGSVQRDGSRLRVNARLVQAGTGALLWSESYERGVDEAFALQGLIARDIAKVVRVSLTDEERARLNQAYRANPQAQDAYLRARVLLFTVQRDALLEARALLERAIAIDPGYQLAYAALSRCFVALQGVGVLSPAEGAALARKAAREAIALDDNAEARLALAHVTFTSDWNWAEADLSYQRALQLNPSFGEANNRYSRFLAAAGRTDEAIEQAARGLELDPLSPEMINALAMAEYYGRRYDEALKTADRAAALGALSHTIRGRILSALGRQDEAFRALDEAYRSTRNLGALAERARIEALLGRREAARQAVAELTRERSAGNGYVFPGDIAFVLVALGETQAALDWLDLAVQERAPRALWLRVDPRVDALRSDSRFSRLLARIGP